MNKEFLKNVIVDQKDLIETHIKSENIIERDGLTQCSNFITHPNILLISGLHRAGKSFFSHLLVKEKKYAYINFDDERLISFKTEDLNSLLESFYELYGDCDYFLFDEIQNIKGWELFINRLRLKYKIIITGSNARLLSSEMATHLTGRFDTHTIFPMSFTEYLRFHSTPSENLKHFSTREKARYGSLFENYLRSGGIFEYYRFGKEHIRSLFSSIITKDILSRYAIKFPVELEELALYMVNSFASKISVNKITKMLGINSPHTIREYIKYLENTFLIFGVNKFSYKLKEQRSAFRKIYIMDNGIIDSLLFDFSANKGRLLENTVAIELKRRSIREAFDFYYWSNYINECDFVIKTGRKIASIYQVCYELTEKNQQREFAGLVEAAREFNLKEGVVLTMFQEDTQTFNGFTIKIVPVWKWLVNL